MIVNHEQDNEIEGSYLTVSTFNKLDSSIVVKLPAHFYINSTNVDDWIIGWGDEKPYYDAGVENIRSITKIDSEKGILYLGSLLRGKNFPHVGQRVVFWNTKPSGFERVTDKPIIDVSHWPDFHGNSVAFGAVEYDSTLEKWVLLFNECDTNRINIYAAVSEDLIEWLPANDGQPILKANDFQSGTWAGYDISGTFDQSAQVTDAIYHNGKWVLFLDGYNKEGVRSIGMATSQDGILGHYEVDPEPIIEVGSKGSWDDQSVFYAKVAEGEDGYYLIYDGKNTSGVENTGLAKSKNLTEWTKVENNPVVADHEGWRSSTMSSEPNYLKIDGDTITLMVAGIKNFRTEWWNRFMPGGMFTGVSGNVYDAQLGCYRSTDGGKTFVPHKNNPLMVNDYSFLYENEHMGGNLELIETDSMDYLIYQAKSSHEGFKYNIILRSRRK